MKSIVCFVAAIAMTFGTFAAPANAAIFGKGGKKKCALFEKIGKKDKDQGKCCPAPAQQCAAPAPEPCCAAPAPAPEPCCAAPAPAPEPCCAAPAPAPEPCCEAPAPEPCCGAIESAPISYESAPISYESAPIHYESAPIHYESAPMTNESATSYIDSVPVEHAIADPLALESVAPVVPAETQTIDSPSDAGGSAEVAAPAEVKAPEDKAPAEVKAPEVKAPAEVKAPEVKAPAEVKAPEVKAPADASAPKVDAEAPPVPAAPAQAPVPDPSA